MSSKTPPPSSGAKAAISHSAAEAIGAKRKRRTLTPEQKSKMYDARARKRMQRLVSKRIKHREEARDPLEGGNAIKEPTIEKDLIKRDTPNHHTAAEDESASDHLKVGTQIPHPGGHGFFELIDHSFFDRFGGNASKNVEHSSANKASAFFKPTPTPFNQFSDLRMAQVGEWGKKANKHLNLVQDSTIPKMGHFDRLHDIRGQMDYAYASGNNPPAVRPGYDLSTIQSAPHTDNTSFIRTIMNTSSVGLQDRAGDLRVH
jgi:hypothetical protein